jgi:hypothetical protein
MLENSDVEPKALRGATEVDVKRSVIQHTMYVCDELRGGGVATC